MIYSDLEHGAQEGCPAAICRALAWLRENDIRAMEPGRYPIEGDDIFVLVQDVTTHAPEGTRMEAHRKYIDLMYWPEAGERIGVARLRGDETPVAADPDKDVWRYTTVENEDTLRTAPGEFCALFPQDAHRPGLDPDGEPVSFRKAVMKIAVSLL